ncbi:MAG: hypothetical protein KDA62_06660 [Planctomycetales bacterium]|nr:hypothetical protein [Planctomycetales bacterium]MCA9222824.1 hypothetical protein [Planctomycetales bacterium]
MSAATTAIREPERRAVILGASNVIRGISAVVATAQAASGSPLDLMFACGHGRSYGQTSCVLGRTLPGIVPCGLWDAWKQRPAVPTSALLTDVGNDLLYDVSVSQITDWVRTCCDRLRPVCERLIITELPLVSLRTLQPRRFQLMRTILFPKSRLSLEQALDRAEQLNANLVDLANQFEASVLHPRSEWYGYDPIHIRAPHYQSAWSEILQGWTDAEIEPPNPSGWLNWLRLRRLRPEKRKLFGVPQAHSQPAACLANGTQLSFY